MAPIRRPLQLTPRAAHKASGSARSPRPAAARPRRAQTRASCGARVIGAASKHTPKPWCPNQPWGQRPSR
eukprot:6395943-Alexandrium_andersonii.AAC.1